MKKHSILFLHPLERKNLMRKSEEYSYVSESSVTIGHDCYTEEIPLYKEVFIDSVLESCSTLAEKERVSYIMELALNKTSIDDDIYKAVLTHSKLPIEVNRALMTNMLTVLNHKVKSDFCSIEQQQKDISKTLLICDKMIDIASLISSPDCKKYDKLIREEFKTLRMLLSAFQNNYYKHLVEIERQALEKVALDCGESWMVDLCHKLNDLEGTGTMTFDQAVGCIRKGTYYNEFMERRKKETTNEINIIMMDENFIDVSKPSNYSSYFEIIPTAMSNFRGGVIPYDKVNQILGRKVSLQLSPVDIFKYCASKPGKAIERVNTTCGQREVCIAYDNLNLEIVAVDVETGDILYVPMIEKLNIVPNMEFICGDNDLYTLEDCKVIRIKYRDRKGHDLEILTEGIKFTEDGGVKLVYKPKSTYMDDYARINKVIVQNARNQNLEGVKTDLVFLFSFINELEKITKGRVKVKDSIMEDAKKARMFAIGDFKQYLAFVQERDPSFNFSKYFEDNHKNEDKVMIEFSNKDIRGFRLLLKTILG